MDERLRFVARLLEGEKMARAVPGVRHLPQDRLQDLPSATGISASRASPIAAAGPTARPTSCRSRSRAGSSSCKQGAPDLGRAQDPREAAPAEYLGDPDRPPSAPCTPCSIATASSRAANAGAYKAEGTPLSWPRAAQRAVVRRLQGRVHARRPSLLLPAHHHRLRQLATCSPARRSPAPAKHTAFAVFERAFKDFGLPGAIRTDNGVPFACPRALFGLSRLSVWWLRLGIDIERIKPGHPQQNGRHERMHLTLKKEATKPGRGQPAAAAGTLR